MLESSQVTRRPPCRAQTLVLFLFWVKDKIRANSLARGDLTRARPPLNGLSAQPTQVATLHLHSWELQV